MRSRRICRGSIWHAVGTGEQRPAGDSAPLPVLRCLRLNCRLFLSKIQHFFKGKPRAAFIALTPSATAGQSASHIRRTLCTSAGVYCMLMQGYRMQQRLTSLVRHAAAWASCSKSVRQPAATALQTAALPAADHAADGLPLTTSGLIWTTHAIRTLSVAVEEVRSSNVPPTCLRIQQHVSPIRVGRRW